MGPKLREADVGIDLVAVRIGTEGELFTMAEAAEKIAAWLISNHGSGAFGNHVLAQRITDQFSS